MAARKESDQVERLTSRVDQQSTLIAMLKQRADKTQDELSEAQQNSESLEKQVVKLQELLAHVTVEKVQLEERFHTLAKNHDEMIRIKDEYKEANRRLSSQQREETSIVNKLQEELKEIKSERDSLEKKCTVLEGRVNELECRAEAENMVHRAKIQELNSSHSHKVTALQKKVEKLEVEAKVATEESEDRSKQLTELQINMKHLKQSLAASETNRQEHLTTSQSLETDLTRTKKELEQTRRAHREELSRDSCINNLRKELEKAQQQLSDLTEEYSAFKKHSNHLLYHERELNNKLRHLVD